MTGSTDNWLDKKQNGALWQMASDWSAGVPTSSSDVLVDVGDPIVENGYAFTVNSIEVEKSATITFVDAGASTVLGSVDVVGAGASLLFDPPGPGPDGGSSSPSTAP
jgi:hypothetical protein